MAKAPAITNRILLQHIQGMRTALETRIERIEKRMDGTDKRFDGTDKRFDGMNQRFEGLTHQVTEGFRKVNDALQRLYTHRVSMLVRIQKLEKFVGIAHQ